MRAMLLAECKAGDNKPFEYVRLPLAEDDRENPKEADIELTIFPVYENLLGTGHSCVGGGGSGAVSLKPELPTRRRALSGCLIMHLPTANQSADSLFAGVGLRFAPSGSIAFHPMSQVMFGGKKVTHESDDLALQEPS